MKTTNPSPTRRTVILATCCLSLLVVSMDATIVNVALSDIRTSLGASPSGLRWIIDAYTVVLASFLMLGGSLADRFGRRRMFQLGLSLFSIGSLLCSLATTTGWLVAARVVQALGGSMMNPVAMAILVHAFPKPKERARAIGIWGAVAGISMALGPLAGGALTEALGWHAIFWINLPIGAVAILLTARFVPESRAPTARRADPVGQGLLLVTLGSLAYALIESRTAGGAAQAAALLALGSLAVFLVFASRRVEPLLDLRFFRSVSFSSATVIAVSMFAAMGGFLFLGSIWLQEVRGLSPFHAGLCILPMAVAVIPLSPWSGRLVGVHGARPSLLVSGAMLTLSSLLMTRLAVDTPLPLVLFAFGVFGAGFGMVNAPVTYAAVSGMPRAQAGLAAAIASTSRQVGTAVGVALTGLLVGAVHPHDAASRLEFTAATHAAWWLFAGLGVVILLLARASTGEWARSSNARIAHLLQEPGAVYVKVRPQSDAERVWRQLVSLVMETRGDWRRKVSETTGLSFSRIRALKRLQGEPRMLRDLADEMGIDAPAATVLVNDLEARGLAQRQTHPDNRRSKLVSLTAAGQRTIARLAEIDDPPPPVLAGMPASQLAALRRLLEKADE